MSYKILWLPDLDVGRMDGIVFDSDTAPKAAIPCSEEEAAAAPHSLSLRWIKSQDWTHSELGDFLWWIHDLWRRGVIHAALVVVILEAITTMIRSAHPELKRK